MAEGCNGSKAGDSVGQLVQQGAGAVAQLASTAEST